MDGLRTNGGRGGGGEISRGSLIETGSGSLAHAPAKLKQGGSRAGA